MPVVEFDYMRDEDMEHSPRRFSWIRAQERITDRDLANTVAAAVAEDVTDEVMKDRPGISRLVTGLLRSLFFNAFMRRN